MYEEIFFTKIMIPPKTNMLEEILPAEYPNQWAYIKQAIKINKAIIERIIAVRKPRIVGCFNSIPPYIYISLLI